MDLLGPSFMEVCDIKLRNLITSHQHVLVIRHAERYAKHLTLGGGRTGVPPMGGGGVIPLHYRRLRSATSVFAIWLTFPSTTNIPQRSMWGSKSYMSYFGSITRLALRRNKYSIARLSVSVQFIIQFFRA
ncbi:hypothetical protein KIN20_038415 [Parelaphostrongylus tenuis]|uniref:Uncharacterized protein n=1 Tax=Parelaphostrongylus tenuis TaxID=148309 RepID=A0AAD5MK30_PARTN|nr:hypothetical protein KIN20_038415 [Parelaphostrongylus tenuis]